jgi:hypothetical protein
VGVSNFNALFIHLFMSFISLFLITAFDLTFHFFVIEVRLFFSPFTRHATTSVLFSTLFHLSMLFLFLLSTLFICHCNFYVTLHPFAMTEHESRRGQTILWRQWYSSPTLDKLESSLRQELGEKQRHKHVWVPHGPRWTGIA